MGLKRYFYATFFCEADVILIENRIFYKIIEEKIVGETLWKITKSMSDGSFFLCTQNSILLINLKEKKNFLASQQRQQQVTQSLSCVYLKFQARSFSCISSISFDKFTNRQAILRPEIFTMKHHTKDICRCMRLYTERVLC